MICPKCEAEYQPGFSECAECGVALVEPGLAEDATVIHDDYVPLTREWGRDYALAVVVASLEDAGFHPIIDCDPRGQMHYYGWPFGAPSPTVIWIAESEFEDAKSFLAAECEPSWDELEPDQGFYGLASDWRPWLYLAWIFDAVAFGGFLVAGQALANARHARAQREEGGP